MEKIMVIKHGALGDMVQAFDGFASLRAGHPESHLTLLTTPPFVELAKAMPFFDDVQIDQRRLWSLGEALRLRRLFVSGLKRIYDFQSSKRTGFYFRYLIPPEVEFVGVHKGASHFLPDMSGVNNRDRMVETARLGGCVEVKADMGWLDSSPDPWRGKKPPKPAVLLPGCSPAKPQKRWPVKNFIALAQALIKEGFTPVLAGTKIDRQGGDAIMAAVPQAIDRIGQTSLIELAVLLRGAESVVGGDTGPVFLGARLGRPTVMLMSAHTDPMMSAPIGTRASWIRENDVAAISPERVLRELKKLA